jgi:hypothetical protein
MGLVLLLMAYDVRVEATSLSLSENNQMMIMDNNCWREQDLLMIFMMR